MFTLLLTALYFLLFNYLIYRFPLLQLRGFKAWVSCALFNIKFAAGLLIWAIYTFYYTDKATSDVHKFYTDAEVIYSALPHNPSAYATLMTSAGNDATAPYTAQMKNWERNFDEAPINENRTVIRLNALLMLFSFNTYFIHILAMCFISLLGWVLLFNGMYQYINRPPTVLALLPLLLPSILFWASGVLKEPILVLGLGLFVYGLLSPRLWLRVACCVLGIALLLAIKFYVLVCVLHAAFAFVLLPKTTDTVKVSAKYLVLYVALAFAAFNVQHIVPRINAMQMLANKQHHSVKEAIYFNAASRIDIPQVDANAFSIIKAAPIAIWNTLMRPYIWEGRNPMMLASALENLMLIGIILLSLLYFKWQPAHLNLMLCLLLASLSYFVVIGLCTPVLGNLVRYKAPLLPLFLYAFIIMADEERLANTWQVLRRINTFCCGK
ncbi:MAG: hypothetical protein JST49_08465 [Bacteroidetes bacterium]|nr:hypothetical protein [Bacteroidota bacterium]